MPTTAARQIFTDAAKAKTAGQIAYEDDVRRTPRYHDGCASPGWDRLSEIVRWSWECNPTPRYEINGEAAERASLILFYANCLKTQDGPKNLLAAIALEVGFVKSGFTGRVAYAAVIAHRAHGRGAARVAS